ncbi:MAG: hypothetical protein AMXMBFR33_35730 [Candidatus Xenobia bacterium]
MSKSLVYVEPDAPVMQALAVRQADAEDVSLYADLDPEMYATEDEAEELADITARYPIVRFNGGDGTFVDVGSKEAVPSMEGVILSALPDLARAWFAAEGDKDWPEGDPICRTTSDRIAPTLNPSLSDEQRRRALHMGAGVSCRGCPLSQWVGTEKPKCNGSRQVLFFDAERRGEVVLQIGGTSIAPLRAYEASFKPAGQRPRPLFSRVTTLTSVDETQGKSKKYKVLKLTRGAEIPLEALRFFRATKDAALVEIEANIQRLAERNQPALPAPAGPEPFPTQEVIRHSEGGLELDENGEVLP